MAGIRRSLCITAHGQDLLFPTYGDLVERLVQEGHVESSADLLDRRPDLLGNALLRWLRSGQAGCHFAAKLARHPGRAGWQSILVREWEDPRLPWHLEPTLNYVAPEWQVVQLIFPGLVEPEPAATLVRTLCTHPDWYWEEVRRDECAGHDHILCGLRWRIPDTTKRSFVLGFGPFDALPLTRRFEGAPFSAFVFRPASERYPKFIDLFPAERDDVHLAAMAPTVPAQLGDKDEEEYVHRTLESTRRLRAAILSGEECEKAGKASVTFCLPVRVRPLLGAPGGGARSEEGT